MAFVIVMRFLEDENLKQPQPQPSPGAYQRVSEGPCPSTTSCSNPCPTKIQPALLCQQHIRQLMYLIDVPQIL